MKHSADPLDLDLLYEQFLYLLPETKKNVVLRIEYIKESERKGILVNRHRYMNIRN